MWTATLFIIKKVPMKCSGRPSLTARSWSERAVRCGHKRKAEYFLFQDEEEFPFVCRSAGLNPEDVREALWKIRAETASESNTNVA